METSFMSKVALPEPLRQLLLFEEQQLGITLHVHGYTSNLWEYDCGLLASSYPIKNPARPDIFIWWADMSELDPGAKRALFDFTVKAKFPDGDFIRTEKVAPLHYTDSVRMTPHGIVQFQNILKVPYSFSLFTSSPDSGWLNFFTHEIVPSIKAAKTWTDNAKFNEDRKRFIDHHRGKLKADLQNATSAVQQIRSEIRNIKDRLMIQFQALSEKDGYLSFLSGKSESNILAEAEANFVAMTKMIPDPFVSFKFGNQTLVVETKTVNVTFKDHVFDLGRFSVSININNNQLSIKQLVSGKVVNSKQHPHVDGSGHCCLGNIEKGMIDLIKDKEYAGALALIWSFLTSYNDNNPYTKIDGWDTSFSRDDFNYESCWNNGDSHICATTCRRTRCPYHSNIGARQMRCGSDSSISQCSGCDYRASENGVCAGFEAVCQRCSSDTGPQGCVRCTRSSCLLFTDRFERCRASSNGRACRRCGIPNCQHRGTPSGTPTPPSQPTVTPVPRSNATSLDMCAAQAFPYMCQTCVSFNECPNRTAVYDRCAGLRAPRLCSICTFERCPVWPSRYDRCHHARDGEECAQCRIPCPRRS